MNVVLSADSEDLLACVTVLIALLSDIIRNNVVAFARGQQFAVARVKTRVVVNVFCSVSINDCISLTRINFFIRNYN